MVTPEKNFVGVDVGSSKKGFHAVLLRGNPTDLFFRRFFDQDDVRNWCVTYSAEVVAVDAPCRWSRTAASRAAERELKISGQRVHCFATPTRAAALVHQKKFYDWVFNGERLYRSLAHIYSVFDGTPRTGRMVIETFPHAVVCALENRVIRAKPKKFRREILAKRGFAERQLPNLDFVDAALCALTAKAFFEGRTRCFGECDDGFIVVPRAGYGVESNP